ncbi:MAG TPA: MerR family transcriptional regulator [Pyrinomonadaceae bacterium]|nr:MerR family transcriptional regulator [Pyrinomonadaceae bacterium]
MNRAAVSIPEKLFFKIGEVCDITGIQAHVLRYWESEFPMLAPQKNRAGQRTYRKRDVEMVLRIKELLYEDQYTIAGAKKRLTNELRGASKLKVVTPEMSAQAAQAAPQLVPAPAPASEDEPHSYADAHTETQESAARVEHTPGTEVELNEDRRDALRHLREHLRELLVLLEVGDSHTPTRPRS